MLRVWNLESHDVAVLGLDKFIRQRESARSRIILGDATGTGLREMDCRSPKRSLRKKTHLQCDA